MNLTRTALSYSQVTILIIAIITILGLTGYQQLSRDAMPPYTVRVCSIVTTFPGASPERVETLVTDKIEKVIQEIPELKTVTSESRTSLSIIKAELKPDINKEDLQAIWDKIRRKVEAIQAELPSNIKGPDIKDDGLGVVYGIQIGLEADGYSYAEMKEQADAIRDDLIRLDEAARVQISGAQEEQIFIEYDNARLAQYGISSNQIKNAISATNIVFPGGQVGLGKERIVIEPTGNYELLEDLKNTLISIGPGEKVKLGDIANVRMGYKHPKESIVKINGNVGLVVAVALQEGANLTKLGVAIDEKIATYNATLPHGMKVTRVASQDVYVNKSVDNFVSNVMQSIVIVLAVMLLFLGLRTGMVVASLIPLTMLMTLMIMNIMGVGLNQVTLASLIMALGMLVDNSIVVSESIMVKMEEGNSPKAAAIDSAKELTIPLLISTLTTSAAFLAFYLAQNNMGEMMGNIFIVITIALLSSLVMALTIVAMLAVYFIKVKPKTDTADKVSLFDRLNVAYKKILTTVLDFPILFVLLIIVMFIGSLMLFPKLPFIFMPDSERNLVVANVDLPLGSKIEETEKVIDGLSDFIKNNLSVNPDGEPDQNGVTGWASFISKGPESYDLGYQPGQTNSGYAHILINTSTFEANPGVIKALDEYAFEQFPNSDISVAPLGGAGGAKYDVGIRITGKDSEELLKLAEQVKQQMAQMPSTKNIKDDWGPKIKKVTINIDQDKAGRANVTNQDIALSLQTALSGLDIGDFRDLDGNIPIIMTNLERENIDVHDLESINVFSQMTGNNVPLIQVANITVDWQIAKIFRKDLNRTITVSCDTKEGYTASDLTDELVPFMEEAKQNWQPGYTYSLGGESEASAEALGAVAANLPIAGFIIVLLLMLQFNSIKKTTIVLLTIPLGVIGVILGLLMFQSYFGFMAFLGVISLAGIVVNNAIVLIDRIDIEQKEFGKTPYQSIVSAAQQRLRPILLTTLTTIVGLIPLYLGGGLMWEPMAVAIMIGLLFATVITLLFVPVLYKLFFKVHTEKA